MTVDYLVNQFVLMNDEQLGIRSLKYPDFQLENFHVSFEWRDWLNAYTERFGLNDDERSVAEALTARRARFGLMDVVKRAQLKRPSMSTTPTGLALRVLEALCGATRRLARGPFPMKKMSRRRAKRIAAQIRRYRRAQAEFESLSAGD